MSKTTSIIVEIDGDKNQSCYFRPLMRRIRGKFDLHRCCEPNAGKLHSLWPTPIPGQRLALDLATGEAAIVEPLWESRFAAIRERIESMGQKPAAEREVFPGVDIATWVYWMKDWVDSGKAKLIEGEFPEIKGTPQTRFHSSERPDVADRLVAAIETQNKLLAELVAKLGK